MDENSPLIQTQFPDIERQQTIYRTLRVRIRYYVPILSWLPQYTLDDLKCDVISGITVAFLIIPQSLSYALLVDVPPLLGLFSAFIPQLLYGILGTSKQLAVGPEALVSILVGSSIKEFTQWRDTNFTISKLDSVNVMEDPYRNIQATALLCLLVGLITFVLGFFRLGFLDSVLSRALLRGFVLAVAGVVMIDMSETLFGLEPPLGQCLNGPGGVFDGNTTYLGSWKTSRIMDMVDGMAESLEEPESPFQKLISTIGRLDHAHFLTTCISITSIAFLLTIRYLKRKHKTNRYLNLIPEILVLVVSSILLSYWFRWDCYGVAILNTVDSFLPDDVKRYPVPTLPKIKHLILSAILISIIGFVESVVVAKTYASKHGYSVSPNRELVALGMGNMISSLFGGFPAYGSLARSAVNDSAGAKTQLSGMVTGVIVFITAMWALPLFQYLPKSVCSAIIITAAIRLIELEEVAFMLQLRAWKDLVLLLMTFLTTLFVSVETGTLISVAVSLLLVVKHTTTTRVVLLGLATITTKTGQRKLKFKDVKDGQAEKIEDGLVIRFEEGLFFGNVGQLRERLLRIEIHGDIGVHPGEDPLPTPQDEDWTPNTPNTHRIQYVIFDMKGVSEIDASAAQTMLEIVQEYKSRSIPIAFVKLRQECLDIFERSGIVGLVGEDLFFSKVREAYAYFKGGQRDYRVGKPVGLIPFRSPTREDFVSFDQITQESPFSTP